MCNRDPLVENLITDNVESVKHGTLLNRRSILKRHSACVSWELSFFAWLKRLAEENRRRMFVGLRMGVGRKLSFGWQLRWIVLG